jgi:RNA polymerase sigma factor (sigma-70 family)
VGNNRQRIDLDAASFMKRIIEQLRTLTLTPEGGVSDGQLLDRFTRRQDEAAFEALLRRHGPLVLGVCRRILGSHHDAEDAFQATFLVLVRKSASVRPKQSVANWLYGVAYRTALKAKTRAARNRARERVAAVPEEATQRGATTGEFASVLDQELNRLSEKYRSAFVLCGLEGKSHQEAARQLGCPEGTLSVRLMRAKQMLAKRLSGRGFGPASALLPALGAIDAASASMPAALVLSTVKAAASVVTGNTAAELVSAEVAALVQGVLQAMMLTRLKIALVLFVLAGTAAVGYRPLLEAFRARGAEPQNAAEQPAPARGIAEIRSDFDRIQGTWQVAEIWTKKEVAQVDIKGLKYIFRGAEVTLPGLGEKDKTKATFKLDPAGDPATIDLIVVNGEKRYEVLGVYRLAGDTLALSLGTTQRPDRLGWASESPIMILKREAAPVGAAAGDSANGRIRQLQVDRLDALRSNRDSRYSEFALGKTTVADYLIDAERRLLEAELELCTTDAERVATL